VQRVALQHDDSKGLLQAAVEWCRRERVVRPGLTTLEEDISTATARAEKQLAQWVHDAPPKKTRQAFWARLDRLVAPGSKGKTERLAYFKEPPGQPRATNLLAICERITQLSALGIGSLDLSKINPNRRKWLANEAVRKSPADLSALKTFKRHGALGCLVSDILQSQYDYAAEMHERLMTENRSRAEAKRRLSFFATFPNGRVVPRLMWIPVGLWSLSFFVGLFLGWPPRSSPLASSLAGVIWILPFGCRAIFPRVAMALHLTDSEL